MQKDHVSDEVIVAAIRQACKTDLDADETIVEYFHVQIRAVWAKLERVELEFNHHLEICSRQRKETLQ
jgi:hypothetical protein